jgi:hypothetical protein
MDYNNILLLISIQDASNPEGVKKSEIEIVFFVRHIPEIRNK